ncbi:cytochrome oxidase c assembly-domain-containing protein [Xylogone sp. PMI_703]|nr:cytochrome oxidase c assembly-domain-containing protein [Xylogone sp. PMI_703]
MPRSATDATRFTSTTPHAFSKPPSSAPFSAPNGSAGAAAKLRNQGPPGETPQEKVKRLKAAAQKARSANISTFDRIILHGRVWADKAHRFTALSLIGLTFICGGVTVYAISDMILWNRRKRAEFFAEQRAAKEAALYSARQAVEAGTATVDQIEFVKLQDEHQAVLEKAAQEKANKKGIFTRTKELFFSGLKKEEEGDDVGTSEARLGYESLSEEDDAMGERESDVLRAIEEKKLALQSKAKEAFAKEKERQVSGGPLDRLGTAAEGQGIATAADGQKSGGGWFPFWGKR